jgi:hypothetical protein
VRNLFLNAVLARRMRRVAALGGGLSALALPAFAQTVTDPLATMVSGVSFANLETDLVGIGVALASLYIVYVGIHWILRMIRHG